MALRKMAGKSGKKTTKTSKAKAEPVEAEKVEAEDGHLFDASEELPDAREPEKVAETTEVATKSETAVGMPTSDGAGTGIAALIEVAEESNGTTLRFPCIKVTSGASVTGMFEAPDFNDAEIRDELPEGKSPISCVLMTYRLRMTSWPEGYDEDREEPLPPVFSCYIRADDAAATRLGMRAAKAYQFTKGSEKSKFDYEESDVGHIKCAIELLVWVPDIGLVEIRSPEGYTPSQFTSESLAKLCDPKSGALNAQPVAMRPDTRKVKSWSVQSVEMTSLTGETGAEIWEAYNNWFADAKEDPDTVENFNAWAACTDSPLTESINKKLSDACKL